MKSIGALLGCTDAKTAWVFGKGPSLDGFDMDRAGPLRICINEAISVVPCASFFFAHDEVPIQRAAEIWDAECKAVLQPKRAEHAIRCGIPRESIFTYEKKRGDQSVLQWPSDEIAKQSSLYGQSGTVHSAIHFCKLLGVISVFMIGFDGGGGYAKCLELKSGGSHHSKIREDSISMFEVLEIEFDFI